MDRWARLSLLRRAGLAACLFAFVVGANWAAFDRYGSDMPDWDQWDAEGVNLLAPWFEHDHFVAHLFQPHNEHRVVLTKLQNLAVVLASGQWDARLECVFNALLHGLIALGFWVIGCRWLAPRWHAALFGALAALYGLPLAWQNLLGGFHSQQYWLIGLSFASIVVLPYARAWSAGWWWGAAAATLALGSMASGFLAAVVVFGVVVWRWLQRDTTFRREWPTLFLATMLIVVGDATRVDFPGHEPLKAKTAHDLIFSLLRSCEWPLRDHDWAGVLLWLPFLVLAGLFLFRRPIRHLRPAQTLLALNGWVLIQLLATAVERGAGADYPASRYMDTLIFATAVNAVSIGWILSDSRATSVQWAKVPAPPGPPLAARLGPCVLALAWLIPLVIGLDQLIARNVRAELPATKNYYINAESHLRGFLATNDPAQLSSPIPYPDANALMDRLSHPVLRALMPECVRPPLTLEAASPDGAFLPNHANQRFLTTATRAGFSPDTPPLASRPTWGSFNSRGPANTGTWQSKPLAAPMRGWLRFETAGDLGEPGVDLEVRDAKTHAVLAQIQPTKIPRASWRSAYVRAPRHPFVVFARDADPHRWLAFSSPVEISTFSYWGWQVQKQGLLIARISALVAILLGLSAWVRPNRGTEPREKPNERESDAAVQA